MNQVKVFVRIKPTDKFSNDVIELLSNNKSLTIHPKQKKNGYINNQILDLDFSTNGVLHNASQEVVFEQCAKPLVSQTLDGYNNTLFCYGQTGAGKTYTMTGAPNNFHQRGVIPRVLTKLYNEIGDRHEQNITVRISYFEIHKEVIYDLLSTGETNELTITENENADVDVKGLSCFVASSEEAALNLLFEGESNRVTGHHQLNEKSSRSHCVFTVYVDSHSRTQSNTKFTTAKLKLVDLAGSERLSKTQPSDDVQVEAVYINKSLTFLEQTIRALSSRSRTHVPYRQSKLTHVLKDSLGGRCNTVMLANIWGEEEHLEETLSTLRFASRVMNVICEPSVNAYEDPVLLYKSYEREMVMLRKELAMYNTLSNREQISYMAFSDAQVKDIREEVQRFVEGSIPNIEVRSVRQLTEVHNQFKDIIKHNEDKFKRKLHKAKMEAEKQDADKPVEVVTNSPVKILVGETDGTNFNVGKAAPTVRPAAPSAVANAKKKNKKAREEEKTASYHIAPTPEEVSTTTIAAQEDMPATKSEAFEMFKLEGGLSLNKILIDNKEVLKMKKLEANSTFSLINETKRELEEVNEKLELYTKNCQEEVTEDGQTIFNEEEFELLQQIRALKNKYRMNYQHLQNLRADIQTCDALVKQSRQHLLAEFDTWYSESFGTPNQVVEVDKVPPPQLDEDVNFQKAQNDLLVQSPESVPFYTARLQTDRKKILNMSKNKINKKLL